MLPTLHLSLDTLPGDFENTWEAEEEATLEVVEVELVSSLLQASPPGFCPSPGDEFVNHKVRKGSSTNLSIFDLLPTYLSISSM